MIGSIVNSLKTVSVTLSELADELVHGATFRPSILVGGRGASNWTEQQVFALDIDHGLTIEEAYEKTVSAGVVPCFLYTSFSHTEKEHRFRIVYCSAEVITDGKTRDRLLLGLMNIIGGCDSHCIDRNRVFFGGCGEEALYPQYDARINADDVINRFLTEEDEEKLNGKKKAVSIKPKSKVSEKKDPVNSNVPLIAKLDAEGLRKRLVQNSCPSAGNIKTFKNNNIFLYQYGEKPPVSQARDDIHRFNSLAELYGFFNQINLYDYLGVEDGMFRCIMPEHDDETPSAHIYTTNDGTQIYKCFGCGQARTITTITEQLAHCTRKAAIEFLKAVYRVDYTPSEWVLRQQSEIIEAAAYLDSTAFKTTYPNIDHVLGKRKGDLTRVLVHMTQYLNEHMQYNGRPIFFMSLTRLMDVCGTKDRNKTATSMALLALLGMIDKLDPSCIPEDKLERAKQISAEHGFGKLVTFYGVPSYDYLSLCEREIQAKLLRDNHFTLEGMSREYVLRTFGMAEADRVYPQYHAENARGTSKASNLCTAKLVLEIQDCLNEQGFVFEADLKASSQW